MSEPIRNQFVCLDGVGFFLRLDFERKNRQLHMLVQQICQHLSQLENRISSFQLDGMIVALVKIKETANIQIHLFELGEEWKPHKALFFVLNIFFQPCFT